VAIRCLSYNIHSCFGADGKYSPTRIRDVILEANADIVALQEVDSSLEVTDGIDQLRYLSESTKMHAVIGPTLKRGYGAYGNAVLSRWPLKDVSELDLTYRRFEPRGVLETTIFINGRDVKVINTHLGLKWWERKFQVSRLLDAMPPISTIQRTNQPTTMPTILMGDFNEWFAWSSNLRKLKKAFKAGPDVKTFPSRWPRFCLDRVFVSQFSRMEVTAISNSLTRIASDHLPIFAEVGF
jgi:endonuclease/exonuclease/phosphatase family metal-dependent hydrolase